MGLKLGVFGFFPTMKISVICQVRMYSNLSVKINPVKRRTGRKDCGRVLFAFVSGCVVGKTPNTPNWGSMADNAITWGGIGVLGSSFYICRTHPSQLNLAAQRQEHHSLREVVTVTSNKSSFIGTSFVFFIISIQIHSVHINFTLHTSSADVVFPTPGGPDSKAALKQNPSSRLNLAANKQTFI